MNVPYARLLLVNDLGELDRELTQENKQHEAQFKFETIDLNRKQELIKKFISIFETCKANLVEKPQDGDVQLNFQIICSTLCAVKTLVRDKDCIDAFNNDTLLNYIKEFCGLDEVYYAKAAVIEDDADEPRSQQIKSIEHLNLKNVASNEELILNAHKCLTNLVYNSMYAQVYFKSITTILVQSIKECNLNARQINVFNLRLLFLLTIFNRDLCTILRDTSDLVTYLIEIMDQLVKERIDSQRDGQKAFFCLNSSDIEYLVEILKLLYNLTIDINKEENMSEEIEAHLMHLVSVLRDLLVFKLSDVRGGAAAAAAAQQQIANIKQLKLNDLHANIVNLLTNMTAICFEELMIPLDSDEGSERRTKRVSKGSRRYILNQQQQQLAATSFDANFEYEGKNMEALNVLLNYLHTCLECYFCVNKSIAFSADQLQPILLLFIFASKSNALIRKYLRLKILPPLREEVKKLPSEGSTLRNYLSKLMIEPNIQLKHLSAQLLYILCKENIGRLMKYTGFGLSAGFLADLGLLLTTQSTVKKGDYSSDSENSDTEEYKLLSDKVNNVTGRYEPERAHNPFENLSEEQIDYIANQLMNNIDKLNSLGIIKPAVIGSDGKPKPVEHVLELTEHLTKEQDKNDESKNGKD